MSRRASWPDYRSMYGTRDAASIWRDTWSEVLKDGSMEVGTAFPAFFCSHDGDLIGLCHGDDFCVVARRKQLQIFGKVLEKRFEVKQTWHIGFSASDAKELKILNRTTKIDALNYEMTLEADTKLVKDAVETMKLVGAKGVVSTRVRIRGVDFVQQLSNEVGVCRSRQVDIAEAVKCLTRHMKEPRSGHMQELKRLGRYLVKKPEMRVDVFTTNVGSNVAGACGL